jgi:hypothetical protein
LPQPWHEHRKIENRLVSVTMCSDMRTNSASNSTAPPTSSAFCAAQKTHVRLGSRRERNAKAYRSKSGGTRQSGRPLLRAQALRATDAAGTAVSAQCSETTQNYTLLF